MIFTNSLKMKKIFIGIILLIVVYVYLFTSQKIGGDREKQFFVRFDSTDINGKLEYVKIRYHLCAFKIEGIEEELYFDPITSNLNDKKLFEHIAEKGDLIVKEVHSDILTVKKNDMIYNYKFRIPND
jgi:hypothetical protein